MANKLTKLDIKQALWHAEFRDLFPELKKEIGEFLSKPTCPCNITLYDKILEFPDRLKKYFPTKQIEKPEESSKWKVVNCHVDDLEKNLKKLPTGQKYISMARYEDQVTVVAFYPEYYQKNLD